MLPADTPRIAIAHDYLTQRGGAERVVLALTRAFPHAPIYTTLYEAATTYPEFRDLDVRTSKLNAVKALRGRHRAALPLLPWISNSIEIDADVVIASSSGWSHGFRTTGQMLVYCYSPARWLYEPALYLGEEPSWGVAAALRALSPALKVWDQRAARRADSYVAISSVTRDRIQRSYGISAEVLPAPHSVTSDDLRPRPPLASAPSGGYFLVVSRLLPYKNVKAVIRAFAERSQLNLVVIGAGPEKRELQALASSNVTFLEGLTDDEMIAAYQGCSALIAASNEDFGLTPIEAAAHGKPSIVLRWGGFLDTVQEGTTGVFFDAPTPHAINAAIDAMMSTVWNEELLRERAEDFSEEVFAKRIRSAVSDLAENPSSARRTT